MIEKMKFVSITGPKSDIDRMVGHYLYKYDIHLENALSELKSVKGLSPYVETNPYKEILQHTKEILSNFPEYQDKINDSTKKFISPDLLMPLNDATKIITKVSASINELEEKKNDCQKKLHLLEESRDKVYHYTGLNYDLSSILHFKYIKFRFGRISKEYFQKFSDYVYDTIDSVIITCREEGNYIWVVYFVPGSISNRIDAIYASMHFERFFLPDEYDGTPTEAIAKLDKEIAEYKKNISAIEDLINETLAENKEEIFKAYDALDSYSRNFDVRKLAACTNHNTNTFYILCGWMKKADAKKFIKEIASDENTFCVLEDNSDNIVSKPPTKLKNPGLFKPFELFIQMYGLPDYNEIDPTIIIGITYSFLFGFMFGDVGQGLCLLLGGLLLYKTKKLNLAAIISCCGVFSTIFGFLFGSVFGFENIIDPLWLRPKEAMTKLPFIGNLNTVFIVAIALGMGIIIMTMILNIINSIRFKDKEKAFFDTNGIAGMVFYVSVVATIVLYMTNNPLPASTILVVMFVIPLIIIFFKEPITALVEKHSKIMPEDKGMFIVQGVFELFEVLLSYFSNTLSFVRVGAFAVSHAAMMEVVLMLAGVEAGNTNWVVIVLGNLFVCGMEGLIVGIQVLRLQYYELFSRFYHGTGREFKPYGHC